MKFVVLLFVFVALKSAESCGISTHTEIIHRAFEFYDNPAFGPGEVRRIILEHQGAFMAGAPFPDIFYNSLCKEGTLHYVSEDTHWGHFQKVAWDYFRRTYPDPIGNEDAEQLMAFLLGMTSHQVADVLYHNLEGLKDGLIEMLSETTFDGDFGKAHDLADFGGDILGVVEWDTSYADKWFVPTDDMYNIIVDYYGSDKGITHLLIEECTAMLLAGRLAEQELGAVIYSNYASQSAIFLDEYQEYFMGGIDDMAAWTRLVWDLSLEMASNGTENCYIPENPMEITCDIQQSQKIDSPRRIMNKERKEKFFKNLEKQFGVSLKQMAKEKIGAQRTGKGIYLKPKMSISTEDEILNSVEEASPKGTENYASFYLDSPYAQLGLSLSKGDVNGDGIEDLLLGAPGFEGRGCLFIVYGASNELLSPGDHNLDEVANVKLCGNLSDPYSRFGHSVLVQDYNGDGLNDIIVGAPTSGLKDITYDGLVHVFLSKMMADGKVMFSSDADVTLTPPKSATSRSSTFGWSLATLRSDSFIISARHRTDGKGSQSGSVFEVDSSGLVSDIFTGDVDYQWSGSAAFKLSQNSGLVVGSPTWNDCTVEPCRKSSGRVDIIDMEDKSIRTSLFGETEFSQFGYFVEEASLLIESIPRRVIIVGSPTFSFDSGVIDNHKHAGSIQIFDLDLLLSGSTQDQSFLMRLDSDKLHGRFGKSLHAAASQLFVGAPRYHGLLATKETGAVFSFSLYGSVPLGNPTTEGCGVLSSKPCPKDVALYVMTPLDGEEKSQFGDSIITLNKNDIIQFVIVSAPKSSRWASQSGVVYVYRNV